MNPDQWRRVKDIFHAAIERAPLNRPAFLMEACGGDEDLLVLARRFRIPILTPEAWRRRAVSERG